MTALTRWVLSHKRLVTGVWVVITIAAFASIQPSSDALSQEFTVPGREGFETNREIAARYGSGGDVAPLVPVVTLPASTTFDAPGVRTQFDAAVDRVRAAVPGSRALADEAFVSKDRRTAYALVYIPEKPGLEPGQAEASRRRRHSRARPSRARRSASPASTPCAPTPRPAPGRHEREHPASRSWWPGSGR